MSDLAINAQGERIPIHDTTVELKVQRCQPPGRPGAPQNVAGPNGFQAFLPRKASMDDLKGIVREVPGRYKLVQVDQQRRPVDGAESFYVEIFDTSRLTREAENDDRSCMAELVRVQGEMVRTQGDMVRSLFDRFASIMDASATLLRAADGAGLPAREPMPAPVASTTTQPALEPELPAQSGLTQVIADALGKASPLLNHLVLTKVVGLSPEQAMRVISPTQAPSAAPPVQASSAPANAPTQAAAVDPIVHMNAIEALLSPREKMIAFELVKAMTPDQIGTWRTHLCTMTAADAATAIRAEVAQLDSKRNAGRRVVIGLPVNDYPCLSQVAELVSDLVRQRDPVLVELATTYPTTDDLAAFIRSLPQRDDTNNPSDGPRAEHCSPPQRLRIPAPDPNCVERAALYLAVAEMIDPRPLRQLATIEIPAGRHTFLVEDGAPIVLGPSMTKNALEAGMFHIEGTGAQMTPEQQVDWICAIAEEPAVHYRNGQPRVRAARDAMRGALLGRRIPSRRLVDVAFTLSLAEREAKLFGARGIAVMRAVMNAMASVEIASAAKPGETRNAFEMRVGHTRIRPDWGTLGAVARATSRVGARVAGAGAQAALAQVGISPALLAEVERELNREGLSLGPLMKATPEDRALFGTLAALAA